MSQEKILEGHLPILCKRRKDVRSCQQESSAVGRSSTTLHSSEACRSKSGAKKISHWKQQKLQRPKMKCITLKMMIRLQWIESCNDNASIEKSSNKTAKSCSKVLPVLHPTCLLGM